MKFDINKVDLSEMDAVFEEWQKNTGVSLNDTTVPGKKHCFPGITNPIPLPERFLHNSFDPS